MSIFLVYHKDNYFTNLIQVDFQLQIIKNCFHWSTLLILARCSAFYKFANILPFKLTY